MSTPNPYQPPNSPERKRSPGTSDHSWLPIKWWLSVAISMWITLPLLLMDPLNPFFLLSAVFLSTVALFELYYFWRLFSEVDD